MKVVIMHRTIAVHDAIGADISRMMDCLSQDHACYAYCENLLNKNLCALSDDPVQEIIQDKSNLIIYHHSGYWKEGLDLLKRAKCKIIIRYHNITPPHFFKQYSDDHMQFCQEGLKQTDTLVSDFKNALWLSDSKYNISDFEKGIRYKVLPPLNYIDKWKDCTPDNRILKELIDSGKINLLFVGRIVPNKSIDFLFDSSIRL